MTLIPAPPAIPNPFDENFGRIVRTTFGTVRGSTRVEAVVWLVPDPQIAIVRAETRHLAPTLNASTRNALRGDGSFVFVRFMQALASGESAAPWIIQPLTEEEIEDAVVYFAMVNDQYPTFWMLNERDGEPWLDDDPYCFEFDDAYVYEEPF